LIYFTVHQKPEGIDTQAGPGTTFCSSNDRFIIFLWCFCLCAFDPKYWDSRRMVL